jgi:hypothetical protein
MTFKETEYDFGTIKQSGGIVRRDFPFTYEGNVPLEITGVPTSCACTTAKVDRTTLRPGESGVLTVTFDPNLHEEPDGKFYKTAALMTDPPLPVMPEVKIWAEVDLDLGEGALKIKDHPEGEGEANAEISGEASAGYIEARATVVSEASIARLQKEYGNAIPSSLLAPDTVVVLLVLDNHREDLSRYDYVSAASLDGKRAKTWQSLSTGMGGHHISGLLTFGSETSPKTLKISSLPIGEIAIPLSSTPP